jgi:hypothetical protein
MSSSGPAWKLVGFLDRLDAWIDQERPKQDLRLIVTDWVMSRAVDPYEGAERERGFANLWFARVPHSHDGSGALVVCAYFVEELTRTVRCSSIATLNWPI